MAGGDTVFAAAQADVGQHQVEIGGFGGGDGVGGVVDQRRHHAAHGFKHQLQPHGDQGLVLDH